MKNINDIKINEILKKIFYYKAFDSANCCDVINLLHTYEIRKHIGNIEINTNKYKQGALEKFEQLHNSIVNKEFLLFHNPQEYDKIFCERNKIQR
jgi:hypothetical protein